MTIVEAADHFAISRKTLYSLIGRGRLPAGAILRLGRQLRINVAAIEAEAEGRKNEP
ncbi:MAG: helix-turn-helix domain-containing protein [Candidatus Aminicenantes bacterium]|nr:helix-turn-helix domain-containing protein [Candidatus Aminicenantes bacterium]